MQVLSTPQLNRTLLLRQGLLSRARRPLTSVVERMGGIQNQYAPNAYIALWSRVPGFHRHHLDKALTERRLIQGTLMRGTIHVVSATDYCLLAAGIHASQREWWTKIARSRGLDDISYEVLVEHVRTLLADGPRRRDELVGALTEAGYRKEHWEGVGWFIDLVRIPPSGTWDHRRADRYGLADDWVGPNPAAEDDGVALLLRRYLAAFGPAPLADVATWAGVPVGRMATVLERLKLRTFLAEDGATLFDLARAPLADPSVPAPPRFVPNWDAMLLVHARRTAVLPEEYRPRIFHTKNPQSVATFLADGKVAGSWKFEGGRIRIEPFDPIPRQTMRQVEEEAKALARFHVD